MNADLKVLVLLPVDAGQRALIERAAPGAAFDYEDGRLPVDYGRYDVIIGNPPPGAMSGCASLRLLQLGSAGADAYAAAMPPGAALACASGAYGPAIAEHLLGVLLMLMKKLHLYRDYAARRQWRDAGGVRSLQGADVLVVGFGDLGSCFGRLCAACGASVTGVRRHVGEKPPYLRALEPESALESLLPRADVVALCLPQTPSTRSLLSRARIERLKPGAYVLNAGRGSAVDTEALCDALEQGRLAGAGLDVTEPEPLPPGHRLWTVENAVITPHVSGGFHLPATLTRVADIAGENLARFVRGEPLLNLVDPQTGYRRPETAL